MIAKESIDRIRDEVDIAELAKKIVDDLKQAGSAFQAPCPFPDHNERTPSFKLNPSKGIYKCFGCGKGGNDPIRLTMDVKQLDFVPALRFLSAEYNIELIETEQTEEEVASQAKRMDYISINRQVADIYLKNRVALKHTAEEPHQVMTELLNKRKLTDETLALFEVGFALDEWNQISQYLVTRNQFEPAKELGLIEQKVGATSYYDIYRNRIIFPVHNQFGDVIGFGGRIMDKENPTDYEKNAPKYLNSAASPVYQKDRVLYGLYQAGPHIRKMKFACVVEGYYDVLSFVQNGMPNTVGACGTALTSFHAKLLKKFTDHIVLIGDGDEAGMKANLRAVDILIAEGLKVEICPLPKKEDPDSFARNFAYIETEAEND